MVRVGLAAIMWLPLLLGTILVIMFYILGGKHWMVSGSRSIAVARVRPRAAYRRLPSGVAAKSMSDFPMLQEARLLHACCVRWAAKHGMFLSEFDLSLLTILPSFPHLSLCICAGNGVRKTPHNG